MQPGEGSEVTDLGRLLTWLLAALVVVSGGGVLYIAATPSQTPQAYTEFYVLNADGQAAEYPTNLSVGEQATVRLGVVNYEGESTSYRLSVRAGERTLQTREVSLVQSERWEEPVTFRLETAGSHRVRFLLFKNPAGTGEQEPDLQLRLWVNVSKSVDPTVATVGPRPVS